MTSHRLDILKLIEHIIDIEGGFVDHPDDKGGATRFGITEAVARENGYAGHMTELPLQLAEKIYFNEYYIKPGFDRVALLSPAVAYELTDTGVNMGQGRAAEFLQRCLNVFNGNGEFYPELIIDGNIGNKTISALSRYFKSRSGFGESVLLKALNGLQCARYIELCEARSKNKTFVFGWIKERVKL